jgi:hypothetical protein
MAIWSYSPLHEVEMRTIHPIDKVGWRNYSVTQVDCPHDEMMTTGSLSMYGEELEHSLEA